MFQFVVFLVLTARFSSISSAPYTGAGCEVDPFAAKAPLLIENGKSSIIYPEHGARKLNIPAGHVVELACPQTKVLTNGDPTGTIVAATCVSGQTFKINGGTFSWNQITCSGDPISISRFTNGYCGGNGRPAEIGFVLDSRRFLQTMQICFDTNKQITLYSHFEMSPTIAISSPSSVRPFFYEDAGFYHLNGATVNSLYVFNGQRHTVNGLLGLPAESTNYFKSGELFLARGHLSARADFVYAAQKNATFKYINAAPQWQSFNAGNWEEAEIDTRNYASSHRTGLQIWTGTYGVTSLPHAGNGRETELYLYAKGNVHAIPVPAIYWKIVYNPSTKRGIVLIGINNPYLNAAAVKKYIICNDVSHSVNWLKWDRTNIRSGYSYACAVPDFRKVVSYAPNLAVSGLLI